MDVTGTLAAVAILGLVLTKLVDTARNMFDENDTAPKWVWNVLGLGLGVAAAFIWGLDVTGLTNDTDIQRWAGEVLTGLALGATASGWHEVLDSISAGATAKRMGAMGPTAIATAKVEEE